MTIWGFGAVIAALGWAAWWWRRVEAPILQWLSCVSAQASTPVVAAPSHPEVSAPDPIPPVLLQAAMQESEPWAREALLKSFYEMHETTKDWGVVQSAFMGQQFSSDIQ